MSDQPKKPGPNCTSVNEIEDECACGCNAYGNWCGQAECVDFHFSKPTHQTSELPGHSLSNRQLGNQ